MELLNPGLELFGAMGVDFPSDTESLFSDRLHGALDARSVLGDPAVLPHRPLPVGAAIGSLPHVGVFAPYIC